MKIREREEDGIADGEENISKKKKKTKKKKDSLERDSIVDEVSHEKLADDTGGQDISMNNDDVVKSKRRVKRKDETSSESRSVKRKKVKMNGLDDKSLRETKASDNADEEFVNEPEAEEPADSNSEDDVQNESSKVFEDADAMAELEQFDGEYFRASIASEKGLDALRKFIMINKANTERDIAAEYLQAGGSILEVLKLLDGDEKTKRSEAAIVFTVVNILVIKTLSQFPQYQSSTEEGCRHLINSHMAMIHSLLSLHSTAKHRKLVLKMLAAIVSLGGTLPKEILAHLRLQSQTVENIVHHTKPTDADNVRTCFIHFLLAFLVEKNTLVIRTLLDKYNLLSRIFAGLLYDSREVVNLVLTTLKNCVLENMSISKTIKLHVFSTPVVQSLVSLYNWKGPTNWDGNTKGTKFSTCISNEYIEEKEIVTNIVHDFLIVLLTSHRHGIIFHDRSLGTSRRSYNRLVNSVLQSLEKPWEHEKPMHLVVKILTACPDLIKWHFAQIESYLEPRASSKWICLMKYILKIIESLDLDAYLKICSRELKPSQLSYALTPLIVPSVIIKQAIVPSFNHYSMAVRHEAILLLMGMLEKTKVCLSVVKSQYSKLIDITVFKNGVTDQIAKNITNVNMILKAWNSIFAPIETKVGLAPDNVDVTDPSEADHLNAILDLLHVCNEVCPQLLNTSLELHPVVLLTSLDDFRIDDVSFLNLMKVKAIQFLLVLDSTEFAPRKTMFSKSLSFLIFALNEESSVQPSKAALTIKMLLNICGLFEGCGDQMDIWINAFSNTSSDDMEEIVNWFIHTVDSTWRHIDKYINIVTKAEEMALDETDVTDRLEDIFQELMVDDVDDKETVNHIYMQQCTSIPPLLCCAIQKMKKNTSSAILDFLSYVSIHTLHCQVKPESMLYLIKDVQELPVHKYLSSWSKDETPVRIKAVNPSDSTTGKISKVLLKGEKIELSEIFGGDVTLTFQFEGKDVTITHSLTLFQVLNLLRMNVFYLTQLAQRQIWSEIQNENVRMMYVLLLNVAKNVSDASQMETCLTIFFGHPLILYYFHPFCKQKDAASERLITETFVTVCQAVVQLGNFDCMKQLLLSFKEKFIKQLGNTVKKKTADVAVRSSQTVLTLLELLPLNSKDIVNLLKTLTSLPSNMFLTSNKSSLSLYCRIVHKLLEMSCCKGADRDQNAFDALDKDFVTKLFSHLTYLKKNHADSDQWESAMHRYFFTFPHNIAEVNAAMFNVLLTNRISDSTVKLLSLLINRSVKLVPVFAKHTIKSGITMENVLPILEGNLTCMWSQEFLSKLHTSCKKQIITYLCQPGKSEAWIAENIKATMYLITNTFDLSTCEEIGNTVTQIGDKLELVPIEYIRILQCLYNRYSNLKEAHTVLMDLTQVLVYITMLTLKKEAKNTAKLATLCESLNYTVNLLKEHHKDVIFEALSKSRSWPQFTRFSLKFGLKESKNDSVHVPLLDVLSNLCDIAYKDECEHEYVNTLFQMVTSHSEFVNIMLSKHTTKRDLIKLLSILVRKNKSLMTSKHVPLYLSAYNATLDEADQYILQILRFYEAQNVKIDAYRPYLWGNAAATHYSVKGKTDTAIWRHPSTSQVLNLFDKDVVSNTVKFYPVERTMKDTGLYSMRSDAKAWKIYDPAFYLPLLCHLLSENNIVAYYRVSQTGALALVLSACCSVDDDVRMAAYTVISRYFFHLEASRTKEKLLWMRLLDALRHGIISLRTELRNVRLNCLVSTFLARTSLVASQPLHPLYSPLHTFLMAKVALDLNTIPELLQLFHSCDLQHKAHRHWILENIRDGIRTIIDVHVALKCVLYKLLLDFYTCSLCDEKTRRLILEVIDATTKLPKASLLLVSGYGLLPWLLEIVVEKKSCGPEFIDLIIAIARNLLNALSSLKAHGSYRHMLLKILLNLKPHLATHVNESSFFKYVNLLRSILAIKTLASVMQKEDVEDIVDISKKFFDNVDECEYILRHNCTYVQNPDEIEPDSMELTRHAMQSLVWTWSRHRAR